MQVFLRDEHGRVLGLVAWRLGIGHVLNCLNSKVPECSPAMFWGTLSACTDAEQPGRTPSRTPGRTPGWAPVRMPRRTPRWIRRQMPLRMPRYGRHNLHSLNRVTFSVRKCELIHCRINRFRTEHNVRCAHQGWISEDTPMSEAKKAESRSERPRHESALHLVRRARQRTLELEEVRNRRRQHEYRRHIQFSQGARRRQPPSRRCAIGVGRGRRW